MGNNYSTIHYRLDLPKTACIKNLLTSPAKLVVIDDTTGKIVFLGRVTATGKKDPAAGACFTNRDFRALTSTGVYHIEVEKVGVSIHSASPNIHGKKYASLILPRQWPWPSWLFSWKIAILNSSYSERKENRMYQLFVPILVYQNKKV